MCDAIGIIIVILICLVAYLLCNRSSEPLTGPLKYNAITANVIRSEGRFISVRAGWPGGSRIPKNAQVYVGPYYLGNVVSSVNKNGIIIMALDREIPINWVRRQAVIISLVGLE